MSVKGAGRLGAGEWFLLARPFTLTASAVPVFFGASLALVDGAFSWGPFLAMLFASVLIQAATNMFNEYYDEKRGLDTASSVGIAGSIVQGRMQARAVLQGALTLYFVALLLSLYLIYVGGWPVVILGGLSALAGYLYTGGPRPVAYTPASEATVFVFMGLLIVSLTYAVQAGRFPLYVILSAVPIGCLVAAILLANNIRDLEADRRGGRRTLPIVFGRRGGISVFRALILLSYLAAAALAVSGTLPFTVAVVFLSLLLGARLWKGIAATTVPERLFPIVKGTAGLHAVFGLLYTAGVLAGPLF